MKNIRESDKRQLQLMCATLNSFENKQIELCSLVSSLEFLLNTLELIDDDWEMQFLTEVTVLESVNALEIIRNAGEDVSEISEEKKRSLIKNAISSFKDLIENELNKNERT